MVGFILNKLTEIWFDCHCRTSLVPSAQSNDLELASLHVSSKFSNTYRSLRLTFLARRALWNQTFRGMIRSVLYGPVMYLNGIHNQLICNPCFLLSFQAMCGLLQCGPVFDPNGLITGGYLYNWLQTVLNSPKEKVRFEREIQLLVLKYSALIGCRQFLDTRVS